jgi:hypothetical protein
MMKQPKIPKQPFGVPLGSYKGVEGFSNGREGRESGPNYIGDVFTGYKYQCVEYARRWLIKVKGLTFESIHCAFQIWDLDWVYDMRTQEPVPLIGIENGSQVKPVVDSLLIYRRGDGLPAGHVAVVTEVNVEEGFIRIAEQNENDRHWPGDYARELGLQCVDGQFWIIDKYEVIGWMVYENFS